MYLTHVNSIVTAFEERETKERGERHEGVYVVGYPLTRKEQLCHIMKVKSNGKALILKEVKGENDMNSSSLDLIRAYDV